MLSSLILFLISKEKRNYIKLKILLFLIGFFIIIFSETTLRFVEGNFTQNIKLMVIPFCLILISYLTIIYSFKINYQKIIK